MNSHGARRSSTQARNTLQFQFDGTTVSALDTDTVASALIAAGYRIFTTAPQDGGPRGGFCFVGRCSDCLMIIDGQPGTMACTTPVRDGMRVETQAGLGHWESGAES
jgi:predicted molibdopterin-dependent oxidoreductase YjgC